MTEWPRVWNDPFEERTLAMASTALAPQPSAPPAREAIVVDEPPSAPWQAPRQKKYSKHGIDAMTIVGYGLTLFGVMVLAYVVYVFGVSRLEQGRSQRTLRSSFANALATSQA